MFKKERENERTSKSERKYRPPEGHLPGGLGDAQKQKSKHCLMF